MSLWRIRFYRTGLPLRYRTFFRSPRGESGVGGPPASRQTARPANNCRVAVCGEILSWFWWSRPTPAKNPSSPMQRRSIRADF